MKKLKSLGVALAMACAAPTMASAQTAAPERPTPAQMADSMCADMAADPQMNITCTPEQKAQLTALIERVIAMPVTDRYSQMAQQHALLEGFRQIFMPNEAPIPNPPRDQFEETAMTVCYNKAQQTGVGCTQQQYDQLLAFVRRLGAMPPAETVEAIQERQQFIRDEMVKIFPELGQQQQQAPSNGATQRRAPGIIA